ncbi:MAG: hypothetical protein ACFB0G_09425 [Leptolyngbyaceae cyanobacterium]
MTQSGSVTYLNRSRCRSSPPGDSQWFGQAGSPAIAALLTAPTSNPHLSGQRPDPEELLSDRTQSQR